ncbi:hypothetical protein NLJ89_g9783 [Agrocybe chaxingu]|uniref:Uncharacterized protein n=1 Tax=Agrocybe chaxingu TaxID=84603 RepID=A0A9W8JV99_9AGAR|nr:hypothetical protein NLJ89_g9783 [Agrocybe chaxingu]
MVSPATPRFEAVYADPTFRKKGKVHTKKANGKDVTVGEAVAKMGQRIQQDINEKFELSGDDCVDCTTWRCQYSPPVDEHTNVAMVEELLILYRDDAPSKVGAKATSIMQTNLKEKVAQYTLNFEALQARLDEEKKQRDEEKKQRDEEKKQRDEEKKQRDEERKQREKDMKDLKAEVAVLQTKVSKAATDRKELAARSAKLEAAAVRDRDEYDAKLMDKEVKIERLEGAVAKLEAEQAHSQRERAHDVDAIRLFSLDKARDQTLPLIQESSWAEAVEGRTPEQLRQHVSTRLMSLGIAIPPDCVHLLCGWNRFRDWGNIAAHFATKDEIQDAILREPEADRPKLEWLFNFSFGHPPSREL